MITKKLFLASSSELQEARKEFEIFINRKNKEWVAWGVFLELILWEDFLDAVSSTRLQDEYNKAIRECDIFVMLFFTKVGQYTEEEFETAFGQFKATNKPFIFTYFKDAEVSTGSVNKKDLMSLWAFQEKLSDLGHFYTVYKNIDELKFKFNSQLDKLAANGFVEFNPDKGWDASPTNQTVHGPQTNITGSTVQGPILSGEFAGPVDFGNRNVNTGGGMYVSGDFNVSGGEFVGRDDFSSTTLTQQNVTLEDFRKLVAELARLLPQANLRSDVAEIIEADFRDIEQQATKASPNGVMVKSRLNNLRETLKNVAGAAGDVNKIVSIGRKLAEMAVVLFP